MSKFRTGYAGLIRQTSQQGGETKTRQCHKTECDINVVMSRYRQTGLLNHLSKHQGVYMDVPDGAEFSTAMNTVVEATESFESLPAEVREHYRNSPALFLDAVTSGKDTEYLTEHKIIHPKPNPAPMPEPTPAPKPEPKSGSGAE